MCRHGRANGCSQSNAAIECVAAIASSSTLWTSASKTGACSFDPSGTTGPRRLLAAAPINSFYSCCIFNFSRSSVAPSRKGHHTTNGMTVMRQQRRVRVSLNELTWEGPVKNWTKGFIRSQRWRCDPIINEPDDLIQEGHIVFLKIITAYPRVIEPRQLMALYKAAFTNLIHDKSCYRHRRHHERAPQDISELYDLVSETTNSGYIRALLDEAPQELKLALELVAAGSHGLKPDKQSPQTLNMKLRRILGLESTFDFKAALHDLLFN